MDTSTTVIATSEPATRVERSVAAPVTSSPASSSASSFGEEEAKSRTELLVPVTSEHDAVDCASQSETVDGPEAAPGTTGPTGLVSAFGIMKDRAASAASKTLGPQLLLMKDKTSKQLGRYQPSIVKAKTSAAAGLTTAAGKVKEGSTQGWSLFKTKLAAAGPAAERIHTMGLNAMADMYLGDTTVDMVAHVEDPKRASCLFLLKYKNGGVAVETPPRSMGLLKLTRAISASSAQSGENDQGTTTTSPGDQCFSTPYVLGIILLFCGDLPVLARVSCVNKSCRDFIASERHLEKCCVRYGHLPSNLRFAYWAKTSNVQKTRDCAELDYDTYLHMGLSKGDATESIMTDVRRTYGRVMPHKQVADHKDEALEEELTTQLSEILHAVAGRFPVVGYCQGMDYIAAHVFDQVKRSGCVHDTKGEAESTFWLLVILFEQYGLHDMFSPGLHTLHVHCFQTQRLLELSHPAVAAHFAKEKVPIEMFIVGWFQTLYLYFNVLPGESLDRIWDIFLFEKNWKIMLRVALALLELSDEYVMEKPIDAIMQFFNMFADKAPEILAEAPLMERALRLKVTNTVLSKLHKQYAKHQRTNTQAVS